MHAKGLPKWMVHQDPDHLTHSQTSRIVSAHNENLGWV
jgi:hypothetical protein